MNQDFLPIEESPLGCEPGTILTINQPLYECPFCGALLSPLRFEGTALDIYAVDAEGFVVRLFKPLDEIHPPCACWPGFWVEGTPPFPFIQIQDGYERILRAETASLPFQ